MSDLTDEELDCTRITNGTISMEGLKRMEQQYKDKPKILEKIRKAKIKIVVKRLISGDDVKC